MRNPPETVAGPAAAAIDQPIPNLIETRRCDVMRKLRPSGLHQSPPGIAIGPVLRSVRRAGHEVRPPACAAHPNTAKTYQILGCVYPLRYMWGSSIGRSEIPMQPVTVGVRIDPKVTDTPRAGVRLGPARSTAAGIASISPDAVRGHAACPARRA
jgi:hypothetical protein